MEFGSRTLADLVRYFARMPGIGRKSAQRLALHLLKCSEEEVGKLSELLADLKRRVRFCSECGSITEEELCAICTSPARNRDTICVVEEPQDLMLLEKSCRYTGLYHVLHGVLSPMDGMGPEELNLEALERRVRGGEVKEVIIATNPTVQGDTTALYIGKMLHPYHVTVTRLARGLPVGVSLEFADEETLGRALERREKI